VTDDLPRLIDPLLKARLGSFSAIMLVGPRVSGKTTTAGHFVRTTVRLDTPGEAAAFRADPDAALRALEEPALLDEWQTVPEVLGAVKRSVDDDGRAGRYLLTGSVRGTLDVEQWPGTGRVLPLRMCGLTIRELTGNAGGPSLLERITAGEQLAPPADTPDLRGYLELAMKGGLPQVSAQRARTEAQTWMRSYVDYSLTRDIGDPLGRDTQRLRRYFTALASHSACAVDKRTLYEAAGINAKTADAYEELLSSLFLLDIVPAWSTNRLNRVARTPKRFVADSSLITATLGLSLEGLANDSDMVGRTLETFVVAQLRPELELGELPASLYHLRAEGGRREVDVVVELGSGEVVGIEVKATSAPNRGDAGHLEWLRDQLAERFVTGLVLHTGKRAFRLSDKVFAAPISVIWSGQPAAVDPALSKEQYTGERATARVFGTAFTPSGPWGPIRYRMADLAIGTIIRVNPELAWNIARIDLAGAESIELLAHGGGALLWSLVRTNDGRTVRVINEDVEPALLSLEEDG
jgi:predicted AAA+ superfamily ATPase